MSKRKREDEPAHPNSTPDAGASPASNVSRIRVVGLPNTVDAKKLKAFFGSAGEVTDCSIIRNQYNNRPRMAFIGYKTSDAASAAVKRLNRSYMDTSKLTVEFAKEIGDERAEDNAWSRHTKKKLLEKKEKEDASKREIKEKELAAVKAEEARKAEVGKLRDEAKERELRGFLEATQGTNRRMVWENDLEDAKPISAMLEGADTTMAAQEEEEDTAEDIASINSEDELDRQQRLNAMSDMDFFKSKQGNAAEATPSTDEPRSFLVEPTAEISPAKNSSAPGPSTARKSGNPSGAKRANTVRIHTGTSHASEEDDSSRYEERVASEKQKARDEILESGRLYVMNLPFTATEEEVKEHFAGHGIVVETHIPLTRDSKQSKGVAFIQFAIADQAVAAFDALHLKTFQGRPLSIGSAAKNPYETDELAELEQQGGGSSYKKLKALKEKAEQANPNRWNTTFMSGDAVASALSKRLQVDKDSLVNKDTKDIATRLAMGEAHLTTEVREMFGDEGLDLSVLMDESRVRRLSDKIIIVKNLPKDTKISDVRALFEGFGALDKVVAPREATIALVSFVTAQEAKVAFRKLAFRQFNRVPLFLEWAPVGALKDERAMQEAKAEKTEAKTTEPAKAAKHEEPAAEDGPADADAREALFNDDLCTLYITNIAFSIKSDDFTNFVKRTVAGDESAVQSVNLAMKNGTSKGFAFVQFSSNAAAKRALKRLKGATLMQRELNVEFSKQEKTATKTVEGCPPGCDPLKLTVKNVPFETTRQDIAKLFSAFSAVKSVRLPRKQAGAAGSGSAKRPHRGFAFVEFTTPEEAAAAVKKLSSTHMYGRHLVIEYAKADDAVGSSAIKDRE
ncbi:Multiple RNA-binding domain-containing protein 1 [Diplonema papillatum]|nr:Multiple RNA-binding domain-containing protein 1 [Diplonema papillatum]